MSTRTLQNNRLNYRIQSLHVGLQPPGSSVTGSNRRTKKFDWFQTGRNIMQQISPTWCTNERNMLCATCWHNMLRSFTRAFTLLVASELIELTGVKLDKLQKDCTKLLCFMLNDP